MCELEQPSMAGYQVDRDRVVLGEYMRRVKEELQPHYDDISSIVYKMRDRFKGDIPGVYPPAKNNLYIHKAVVKINKLETSVRS